MVSNTNEQALEASIEKALTGHCLEDQKIEIVWDTHKIGGENR